MGLAPTASVKGGLVWVVTRVQMPVVLRGKGNQYEMLEACYCESFTA